MNQINALFRFFLFAIGVLSWVNTRYLQSVIDYQEHVRAIICLRISDGAHEWACEALTGPQEQTGRQNSPASPTPVVVGNKVYGYFGSAGLMCCDLEGKLVWTNTELPYDSSWGPSSSPVAASGLLVIVSDPPGGTSHVWGIDCSSGVIRWTRTWPADPRNISGNNRTPLIKSIRGKSAVLVWSFHHLRAFALETGEDLGSVEFEAKHIDIVASMTSDDHHLYLAKTGQTDAIVLDRLGTQEDPILWTTRKAGVTCSSPVLVNDLLFLVNDGGIASCLDAKTGTIIWRSRLKGQYFSSLVATGRHVYFQNNSGHTTVVSCSKVFEEVATNSLGEDCFSSIAIGGDRLFIRTSSSLYCFGP